MYGPMNIMITMYIEHHVKCGLFWSGSMETEFYRRVFEESSNVKKIRKVRAEFYCADRRKYIVKLIVAFGILQTRLKILRSAHTLYLCVFVWIWEQIAIISLYNINWLVCVTKI